MSEYLTVKQVAEILKVSASTIGRLCRLGVFPGHKVGRQIRISQEAVESYLEQTSNEKGNQQ